MSVEVRTMPAAAARKRRARSQQHLACPFCSSYEVERLFVASARIDSCVCDACGARWDEDPVTGEYLGRADRSSVLMPRAW
jgi:transcription elongation factor Elf1